MISLYVYIILVEIAALLTIYAWIDHESRIYANIVAAFMAAMLFTFLATLAVTDVVYEKTNIVTGTTTYTQTLVINGSSVAATVTNYEVVTTKLFNSSAVAGFLGFAGFAMFVYTLIMAYEAWIDHKRQKEELIWNQRENMI